MVGEIVMKQFSLEEYLKNPNRKIVTRDGRNVRIICTDRNHSTHPIIALVQNDKIENTYSYRKNGSYLDYTISPSDLFFAPEKKEGWIKIYKNKKGHRVLSAIYNTENEAIGADLGRGYYIDTIKIEWEE